MISWITLFRASSSNGLLDGENTYSYRFFRRLTFCLQVAFASSICCLSLAISGRGNTSVMTATPSSLTCCAHSRSCDRDQVCTPPNANVSVEPGFDCFLLSFDLCRFLAISAATFSSLSRSSRAFTPAWFNHTD